MFLQLPLHAWSSLLTTCHAGALALSEEPTLDPATMVWSIITRHLLRTEYSVWKSLAVHGPIPCLCFLMFLPDLLTADEAHSYG